MAAEGDRLAEKPDGNPGLRPAVVVTPTGGKHI
jgi:hypothetical protein